MIRPTSFASKLKRGITRPHRIVPFFRRAFRNWVWRRKSPTFLDFYSKVVSATAAGGDPDLAIGSDSHDHWNTVGKLQFDYLIRHGLSPEDRFLDIGCGNLRLGCCMVPFLGNGCYTGIDISPEILQDAYRVIREANLQSFRPYLYLVRTTDYGFLPESHFDRVQAHSVFSHLPLEEIRKVLLEAHRVMKPGAVFDFTYFEAASSGSVLDEDFTYPRDVMLELAVQCGFEAKHMGDWQYLQQKIRATKRQ